MSKADEMNQLKVDIKQWQPTNPEDDQEFFDKILSQLKAIKEDRLRNPEWGEPWPEEAIQKSLAYLEGRLRALKPGDSVPLAQVADRVVGYMLMRWDESEHRMQLEQFYVDRKLRSQGIGSDLLRKGIQHARASHTEESRGVFLNTGEKNEGAQRLYGRFGFHQSEKPADEEGEIRLELDFGTKSQ